MTTPEIILNCFSVYFIWKGVRFGFLCGYKLVKGD